MLGKWDSWYKNIHGMSSFRYGNTVTYQMAEDFLTDLAVEDWGCGTGGFKRIHKGAYIGVDGSKTPHVDKIADLRSYKSKVEGIVMRHVLEHNYGWKKILKNALSSFNKKLCIIIFTPFSDKTQVISQNKKFGIDVPDISFSKKDIEKHLKGFNWTLKENIKTKTGYGVEHVYFIEKVPKIAVISVNLGGFDNPLEHAPQSIKYDYFLFTDENFPPRENMTARLQAKIPKCFAWQMVPGYEYYFWIDGNLSLKHPDSLNFFLDSIQGHDFVALRHNRRPNIRQETRYLRKGIRQQSIYIINRYLNEWHQEQYSAIRNDKSYIDDLLLLGGVFMYRNTPIVQQTLKQWWYHITRYLIMDQLSFSYVLKKNGMKINVLSDIYNNCWFLGTRRHRFR